MRVSYVTFCDPDGFSTTSNGPVRVCHQPDTVNVTEVIFLQRKKNRSPDLYPLAGCLLIHSFFFFVAFLFVSFSSQQAWWLLWLQQSWNGSVVLIFGYGHRNSRRGHLPHTHTHKTLAYYYYYRRARRSARAGSRAAIRHGLAFCQLPMRRRTSPKSSQRWLWMRDKKAFWMLHLLDETTSFQIQMCVCFISIYEGH